MEIYNGKLISADFEESTMEFEIQHEFTVKAGDFVILRKEDYDKLNKHDVMAMLPTDEQIDGYYPERNSSGTLLDYNMARRESAKEMIKMVKDIIQRCSN